MQRVAENHGFDGDWRLESLLTMGACLSRREDRAKKEKRRQREGGEGGRNGRKEKRMRHSIQ